MGRRTLLLIASLLVAALGTALIWLYVRGADQRALGNQTSVRVWVTKAAVTVNTPADTVIQQSETREVAQPLAVGALTSAEQIKGLVAAVPLPPGVVLTPGMFISGDKAPLPLTLDKGKVAVSVQVGDPQRVAGFLTAGSKIGIFGTFKVKPKFLDPTLIPAKLQPLYKDKEKEETGFTKLILDKVTVLTTGSTATVPVTRTSADGQTTTQNLPQSIITVELEPEKAQQLIQAQADGQLYFVLLNPDGSANPNNNGIFSEELVNP